MGEQNERTYVDMLNDLKRAVEMDSIPYQQKALIEDEIDTLFAMLWPYSG